MTTYQVTVYERDGETTYILLRKNKRGDYIPVMAMKMILIMMMVLHQPRFLVTNSSFGSIILQEK